jgi:hypothetical protein
MTFKQISPLKQYMHTYNTYASFSYSVHLQNNLYAEFTKKEISHALEE